MNLVVYDCETQNVIPTKGEEPLPGIEYAMGWGDHAGMGISCLCAYIWGEGYRVFLQDNFAAFAQLAMQDSTLLIGFNNRAFDEKLLAACLGVHVPEHRSWDLLREVRRAKGANPDAPGGGTGGLDGLSRANFLPGKESTANSPLLWQQGKRGAVIDACLKDVMLTKKLVELALSSRLRCPETGRKLEINIIPLQAAVDAIV
jgi:hypothetical protein